MNGRATLLRSSARRLGGSLALPGLGNRIRTVPELAAFLGCMAVLLVTPLMVAQEPQLNKPMGESPAAALLVPALLIEVEKNDGEMIEGKLRSLSNEALSLQLKGHQLKGHQIKGQWMTIATEDLAAVRFLDAEIRSRLRTSVRLRNGSQISARDVGLESDKLMIRLPRQAPMEVEVGKVQSVRFQGPSAITDPVWLGIRGQPSRGDKLVIRRPGEKLDVAEGLILGIADNKVEFDLEGDKISAPLKKLEGILLGGKSEPLQAPPIQVTDVYGSTWQVESIKQIDPNALRLEIDTELTHVIGISLVDSIRWSGGRKILANEPAATTHLETQNVSEDLVGLMNQFFGPQPASDAGGTCDLLMRGNSVAAYRIEAGFQRATGSVRFDSDVEMAGRVTVQIKLDDKVVWEQPLENADPLGFDIELKDANRIELEVVCQGLGNIGTTVRWINPKLMK